MFDIGFWELCLVAVVALIVFGPEKLPEVARSAGLWIGRARRFMATVKQEIDRELHLQEARDAIKRSEQGSLHQFLEETKTGLNELQKPIISTTDNEKTPLPANNNSSPATTSSTVHRIEPH
jgi:sec-independent protein translocase protein TatB